MITYERKILKSKSYLTLLVLGLFIIGCDYQTEKESKPNVILIMTDDQGYGDLACHGNPYIKTPNLDKLYHESVRFTNFHVNPFCAPTRAALLTGRFSDLTHVRTTINGRNHLNTNETTLAEYFKASGYATGHYGKWHLGRNYPFRPMDRGFDQWVGLGDGGIGTASDYWGNDKMNDHYLRNGKWEAFEGYSTDIFFEEAMNFIGKNKDDPFFVYLATNVPHAPWNVLKEWRDTYSEELDQYNFPNGRSVRDFFAAITRFDENLGRMRQLLQEKGLSENTILIFLTDNGTIGGNTVYDAGMRGKKGSLYEGGHRVPCFVHWPEGELDHGSDITQMTAHLDILPTLIDLCGLKTPDKVKYPLSGQSWSPLLADEEDKWPEDRTLFMHSQNLTQQYEKWENSVVATEAWRLVNQNELYNIKSDPGQKSDVAKENPDVVSSLQAKYETYWEDIEEGKSDFQRPLIGSGAIDETWLISDAWIPEQVLPYTFGQFHVNKGAENYGFWPVTIAKSGTYKFEVRRWPKELNHSITSAPEAQSEADIYNRGNPVLMEAGTVIPAKKVRLRVGDADFEKEINADDEQADFNVDLTKGDTEVQAWLLDSEGNKYPAYYVYVNE